MRRLYPDHGESSRETLKSDEPNQGEQAVMIDPITPRFAAEIGDVDLSKCLSDEVWDQIQTAFWQYSVLVFPDQSLSIDQHLDFARRWGTLQSSIEKFRPGSKLRVPPEIADVSNLTKNDVIWDAESPRRLHEMGNRLWHSDNSFRPVPALASILYARSIPPVGGRTEFADLRAAYDALDPDEQHQLEDRVAEHCIRYSRARIGFTNFSEEEISAMPPVKHAMIRRIPQTGRRTLYVSSHARHVLGMPEEDGCRWVDRLIEHATQRQFVYIHRWRENDLVMWDNRCTMHRGTPFDDIRFPRDMQRATVADVGPTCEQDGISVA